MYSILVKQVMRIKNLELSRLKCIECALEVRFILYGTLSLIWDDV